MDFYSWIAMLTLIAVVLAVWKVRKRKEYQYSLLDTSGIILNVVLAVMVYPPISLAGGLLGVVQLAPGVVLAMGRLLPAVCVVGIGASIVLRRKERPGMSFLAQFAGGAWFCATMLLSKLMGVN